MALILAPTLVLLGGSPAAAHPGADVFEITVGVPTSIGMLVPADYGKPIVRVEVDAAAGFDLRGGEGPDGSWTAAVRPGQVTFSGGTIGVNDEAPLFSITGEAPHKATLVFPVTVWSPDGTVMRYPRAVVVYAGFTPRQGGVAGGGIDWTAAGGGALAVVGIAGSVVLTIRRRQTPDRTPPD
jgi:hypothetical protein